MKPLLLCLCVLAPLAACQGTGVTTPDPDELTVPADWKLVDSGCPFSFRAPPEMTRQDVRGIDSCVGEYASPALRVSYDHGGYSDPLRYEDRPGYREDRVLIDGQVAKLISFRETDGSGRHVTAAHFADLGRGARLTVWTEARDEATAALARRMIYSIDFK